jgi:hypothetical protein
MSIINKKKEKKILTSRLAYYFVDDNRNREHDEVIANFLKDKEVPDTIEKELQLLQELFVLLKEIEFPELQLEVTSSDPALHSVPSVFIEGKIEEDYYDELHQYVSNRKFLDAYLPSVSKRIPQSIRYMNSWNSYNSAENTYSAFIGNGLTTKRTEDGVVHRGTLLEESRHDPAALYLFKSKRSHQYLIYYMLNWLNSFRVTKENLISAIEELRPSYAQFKQQVDRKILLEEYRLANDYMSQLLSNILIHTSKIELPEALKSQLPLDSLFAKSPTDDDFIFEGMTVKVYSVNPEDDATYYILPATFEPNPETAHHYHGVGVITGITREHRRSQGGQLPYVINGHLFASADISHFHAVLPKEIWDMIEICEKLREQYGVTVNGESTEIDPAFANELMGVAASSNSENLIQNYLNAFKQLIKAKNESQEPIQSRPVFPSQQRSIEPVTKLPDFMGVALPSAIGRTLDNTFHQDFLTRTQQFPEGYAIFVGINNAPSLKYSILIKLDGQYFMSPGYGDIVQLLGNLGFPTGTYYGLDPQKKDVHRTLAVVETILYNQ